MLFSHLNELLFAVFVAFCPWIAQAAIPTLTYPDITPPSGINVWCGKAYETSSPAFSSLVDAGWTSPPPPSEAPLLYLDCRPRLKPYLEGDDGSIVVEAKLSNTVGAALPSGSSPKSVTITVSSNSTAAALVPSVEIPLSSDPQELSFDLSSLSPSSTAYEITCAASLDDNTTTTASAILSYLPPNPYGGSTVQLDTVTDKLIVHSANGTLVDDFFPIGYYIDWGNYLSTNFSMLTDIKNAGYTLVHPIPGGGNASEAWGDNGLELMDSFFSAVEAAGLWVMYDMRWTYNIPADLQTQILRYRSQPSLLLWYTADEPDGNNQGTKDSFDAYNTISALDGYHPISLVLNCANYFFPQYASGADILLSDVYPIDINTTFSTVWGTVVNRTYGDCGCDNCVGRRNLTNIPARFDSWRELAMVTGVGKKTFWSVPQAFGDSMYWPRYPTTQEVVDMSEVAIDVGITGLVYWNLPTQDQVWNGSNIVAQKVNPPSVKASPKVRGIRRKPVRGRGAMDGGRRQRKVKHDEI